MRGIRELFLDFPNCATRGLNPEEVELSRQRFGFNRLTPMPRERLWWKFAGKFDEPIIRILLAACLLKIVVDLLAVSRTWGIVGLGLSLLLLAGWVFSRRRFILPFLAFLLAIAFEALGILLGQLSHEGLAVMIAVLLATGVAFLSEWKSDREFELLNARKNSLRVKAVRDGVVQNLSLEEVVAGDLIEVEAGDELPADGRVLAGDGLSLNQSLLTGEPEPVAKQACPVEETAEGTEHSGCVYSGTQVVEGSGRVIIADVGDMTMIGQIARRLATETIADDEQTPLARVHRKLSATPQTTPLQRKLSHLAELISRIGYAASIAIFLALAVQGYFAGEWKLSLASADVRASVSAFLQYFVYMVVIIVVAVPEGLPMSVTVSLALAMRKMARANCHVRQLMACETIGSASVICTDKTGTLTLNQMRVDHLRLPPGQSEPSDRLIENAALNSTAHLEQGNLRASVIGNSTEGALLMWLRERGQNYEQMRSEHPILHRVPFSSERKQMRTVYRLGGEIVLFIKGAPESILAECRKIRRADGSWADIQESDREAIRAELAADADRAMRTLAFAHAVSQTAPEDESYARNFANGDMAEWIYDGYAAIRDPIRTDAAEALRNCRTAGIDVKMITGDNAETAATVGREIGLLDAPDSLILSSKEFTALSDSQLKEMLPRLKILARATPLDKLRLVRLLQSQEQVVAVTGDGTNDAPALKQADVGLAMGLTGTEVAKEASKIVLLDDSFATILRSVHWGRALYENIQRFLQFQLTINVSALAIALFGPFVGVKPPFTVLQLLWINVIMDTLAAIALCSEPPRPGLMRRKPVPREADILTPAMRYRILATAGFFVIVMLPLLLGMKHLGWFLREGDPLSTSFPDFTRRQISLFFTTYVFCQVWNQINCRSLVAAESGLHRLWYNPVFLGISLVVVLGQIVIVSYGESIFDLEPLRMLDWVILAAVTSVVLLFGELLRRFTANREIGDER